MNASALKKINFQHFSLAFLRHQSDENVSSPTYFSERPLSKHHNEVEVRSPDDISRGHVMRHLSVGRGRRASSHACRLHLCLQLSHLCPLLWDRHVVELPFLLSEQLEPAVRWGLHQLGDPEGQGSHEVVAGGAVPVPYLEGLGFVLMDSVMESCS